MDLEQKLKLEFYNRPVKCKLCGGLMAYKGIGEYECEDCKALEYDDYGKVRSFLEKNRGATATQISIETGVSQKDIRQMVKESKFEVTSDSNSFLFCELCRKSIRSGRYCMECEKLANKKSEEELRQKQNKVAKMQGYGTNSKGESGAKRFER